MAAKKNVKEQNGEGNVRQLKDGSYECLIQSKYLNPKTGKPKRIKRKAATEKEAREKAEELLEIVGLKEKANAFPSQ